MQLIRWAKHTLGVPGEEKTAVKKGQAVWVEEFFQDENEVWVASFSTAQCERYTVAACHLRRTQPEGGPSNQGPKVRERGTKNG